MEHKKKSFREMITFFMNKSKKDTITIVVLIGILFLVITIPTKKDTSQKGSDDSGVAAEQSRTDNADSNAADSAKQYEAYLENKIVEILTKTEGVGNVKVMVTLKNTSEKILAENWENSREELTESDAGGGSRISKKQDENVEKITVEDKNGNSPYVTRETMPEIEGVVVVAQGGADGKVAADITAAIEALFGIATHKIKVLKMS